MANWAEKVLVVVALLAFTVLVGAMFYYCPAEDLDELVEALSELGLDE